jgi:hypothetical protein
MGRYDAIGFNRSAMRVNSLSAASFTEAAAARSLKAKIGATPDTRKRGWLSHGGNCDRRLGPIVVLCSGFYNSGELDYHLEPSPPLQWARNWAVHSMFSTPGKQYPLRRSVVA